MIDFNCFIDDNIFIVGIIFGKLVRILYKTERFQPKDINEIVSILTSIFDNSHDGLYVCDGDGNGLLYNDATLNITGHSHEVIFSIGLYELLDMNIIPNSAATIAIETKQPYTTVIDYYNGKKAIVAATPFLDENQKVLFVVSYIRDITEINRLHNELEKTREINTTYQKVFDSIKNNTNINERFIYKSEKMQQIKSLAERFAKNDSPILILGESGTGKNVLANYIHEKSERTGSMINVNCGAIPGHLLESELFGYEKGAFTGASKPKEGLFELAHNGTIFLDEIGELPYELQVKLLNVLQDSKVRRLGGTKTFELNVRVIAATNANLEALIEKKKFRLDLFYRLNVLTLTIPSLRERKEDILTHLFYELQKLKKKYNREIDIDNRALENLIEYDWPGNIRELKNVVERAFHMSDNKTITSLNLPLSIAEYQPISIPKNKIISHDESIPLKQAVNEFEKEYITKLLNKTSTMQECADILGINISTLVRKKRSLGIR